MCVCVCFRHFYVLFQYNLFYNSTLQINFWSLTPELIPVITLGTFEEYGIQLNEAFTSKYTGPSSRWWRCSPPWSNQNSSLLLLETVYCKKQQWGGKSSLLPHESDCNQWTSFASTCCQATESPAKVGEMHRMEGFASSALMHPDPFKHIFESYLPEMIDGARRMRPWPDLCLPFL